MTRVFPENKFGIIHCRKCGFNYCPEFKEDCKEHEKYCSDKTVLRHHEHDRQMLIREGLPGNGYFEFVCGYCGEQMKVFGIWIDHAGRLIINGRCPGCGYTDVRKVGIDIMNLWIQTGVRIKRVSSTRYPVSEEREKPEKRKRPRRKRSPEAIGTRLRFIILERDHFTCQYCGHSDVTSRTLHVDHKIPVSKGGKTVLENLITACNKCNLGKSNLILVNIPESWRKRGNQDEPI